jgi:hypothetical protein
VVGAADIQTARPHHSAEIVNRIPGVLNIDLGGEGSTVALRLPINYSAVYGYLEDGIPIRSTGFFNHNALYEINVPGSERVEVFKGPVRPLWQRRDRRSVHRPDVCRPLPERRAVRRRWRARMLRATLASASNPGDGRVRGDLNLMHFAAGATGRIRIVRRGRCGPDSLLRSASQDRRHLHQHRFTGRRRV